MRTNSYIKLGTDVGIRYRNIMFDDTRREDTMRAFREACEVLKRLPGASHGMCFWRIPAHAGPWDAFPVVGHRSRVQIANDANNAALNDDRERFALEIDDLNRKYLERRGVLAN